MKWAQPLHVTNKKMTDIQLSYLDIVNFTLIKIEIKEGTPIREPICTKPNFSFSFSGI